MAPKSTFGIGEWFGRSFVGLTPEERLAYADAALSDPGKMLCLPRTSASSEPIACSKRGGVCSIREYGAAREPGSLRITCPHRFAQNNSVFEWIGEIMLGTNGPLVLKELKFLESSRAESKDKEIGNIDNVLVHPELKTLHWCAVEKQAVYFSGSKMLTEFTNLQARHDGFPLPVGRRHPDYRSSGPKRLLPQLQVKVRTLRPWGKKLAVVIDSEFFHAMAQMDRVSDISNAEIAWFIVRLRKNANEVSLERDQVYFTTLDAAVQGLTGGHPVTLKQFEERIARKLAQKYPLHAANLGFLK